MNITMDRPSLIISSFTNYRLCIREASRLSWVQLVLARISERYDCLTRSVIYNNGIYFVSTKPMRKSIIKAMNNFSTIAKRGGIFDYWMEGLFLRYVPIIFNWLIVFWGDREWYYQVSVTRELESASLISYELYNEWNGCTRIWSVPLMSTNFIRMTALMARVYASRGKIFTLVTSDHELRALVPKVVLIPFVG
jgi:hypothetical protein